ncbi:MAG: M20/M25/M40 family metallo-hydrolase [Nitrospirae bacterium]|nr:M20/M25/M40 family metallo-hydrolase [Nitrospirota bacterium]
MGTPSTDLVEKLDWKAIEQETVQHLQRLIRFESVNPPGNEDEPAHWIEETLRKEGYDPFYVESAPRRGNVIARYSTGGKEKPILLNAHLDVVPASARHWKHPPFSGEIHEGCVWGRGALDMKGMAAMCISLMQILRRHKVQLSRDIIFAASADEEVGGLFGAGFLVDKHPKQIEAEYSLSEVGGFTLYLGQRIFYPIQVAERGICWMKIRTKGDPGHGSMPHDNQAVVKLARVIERLNSTPFPSHQVPVFQQFLKTVASAHGFPLSIAFSLFADPTFGPFLARNLVPKAQRKAMQAGYAHSASVTVLKAGMKTNVIPDEAEAEVDGRVLPGHTIGQFIEEFRAIAKEDLDIEPIITGEGITMPSNTPLFATLADSVRKHHPEGIPVPYMIPGMTDARHFSRLGITTYGFSPMKLPKDFSFNQLFHGHDERIPIEALTFGVRVLSDAILRFAGQD